MAGTEAEDRTQGPSKQRLQQAREQGQVPHSPELTAAAGLLAATVLLGGFGDDLAAALIGLLREHLARPPRLMTAPGATELAAWLRHTALAVAWPLGMITGGAAAAAVVAHQIQVRGLWVPGLLAPDLARLWPLGRGPGLAARGSRGAWGLLKVALVVALAALALRADAPRWQRLARLESHALAVASAEALGRFTLTLTMATLALGLLDYLLQHRRYTALLRMTSEEHRADLRSMEGDPALRALRRRIARTRRTDPDSGEVFTEAVLVVTGAAGLTVVIGGGPPPRRLSIRSIAQGASGLRLRHAAAHARIPEAAVPALALRLASRRTPGLILPPEDVNELAVIFTQLLKCSSGSVLPGSSHAGERFAHDRKGME